MPNQKSFLHFSNFDNKYNCKVYREHSRLIAPEEIAEWKNERRKRFPTKANVDLRQKLQQQRIKRGELLDISKYNYRKQINNVHKQHFQKSKWHKNSIRPKINLIAKQNSCKKNETNCIHGSKTEKLKDQNALGKISGLYVYNTDTEEEIQQDENGKKNPIAQNIQKSFNPIEDIHERKCDDGISENLIMKTKPKYNKSTLLEKLIQVGIRHERNLILQCVRFVRINKFFVENK